MKNQLILEVPESFSLASLDEDAKDLFAQAGVEIPFDIMPGTKVVGGLKIIIALSSVDAETLIEWANVEMPAAEKTRGRKGKGKGKGPMVVRPNMGWTVRGKRGPKLEEIDGKLVRGNPNPEASEADLIKYFLPIFEHDDDGAVISETPLASVAGRVACWAGNPWSVN